MNWKKILLGLIGVRILCWGSILYGCVYPLIKVLSVKQSGDELDEVIIILGVLSVVVFILILIDAFTILSLIKEKRLFTRLSILFSGIMSFLTSTSLIGYMIYWIFISKYSTGYVFQRDHLGLIIIFLSSISSIVIMYSKGIGKRKKSDILAEPIETFNAELEG